MFIAGIMGMIHAKSWKGQAKESKPNEVDEFLEITNDPESGHILPILPIQPCLPYPRIILMRVYQQ